MAVYYSIIVFLLIFSVMFYRDRITGKQFMFLFLLVLFFISAFRDVSIGKDYIPYAEALARTNIEGTYYMEKGYVLLNKLILLFTNNYIAIAISVDLILMIPLYKYICATVEEKYYPVAMMVFSMFPYMYLQSTFNLLRQCCAIGFILLATYYLQKERKLLFFFFVVIAFTFHKSAIIVAVLPLILKIHWKQKTWIVIATTALLLNLINATNIINFIATKVGYNSYTNYEGSLLNNKPYVLFVYLFIIWLCYNYTSFIEENNNYSLIDIYLFTLCFLLVAVQNDMMYRIYIYFAYISIPAIPWVIKKANNSRNHVITASMYSLYYIGFFAFYILYLSIQKNTAYVPYKFIF